MAQYPPGPYQLEIPYITEGFTHYFHVNCDAIGDPAIGTAPLDVDMRTKGSGPTSLVLSANLLWATMRTAFSSQTLATNYTLWKYNTSNQDRIFISGGDLETPNGSAGAAPVLAWGAIYTYRTGLGNVGKLQIMEPAIGLNTRAPMGSTPGFNGPTVKAYLLGSTNIVMARDRSFPVAAMNEALGQNETLADKRFRS